ncbi:MAG: S8 family serine peptidase, partial [Candidatus Latescibacterota bacterium]
MTIKQLSSIGLVLGVIFTILAPASFEAGNDKIKPAVRQYLASAAGDKVKVWIYFKDHGERNQAELNHALTKIDISERAITRRLNRSRGPLFDQRDLPVNADYLHEIKAFGVTLKRTSKYLNAVSAAATPSQIRLLADLPFVSKIDKVHTAYRRQAADPVIIDEDLPDPSERGWSERRSPQRAAAYGPSYKQLDLINVIPLHDNNIHGEGVLVAMLDTGYNRSHEALDHFNIVAEWDFIFEDSVTKNQPGDVSNQHNHGTYTLSALGGYAPGNLIGPAWAADFILAKTERMFEEVEAEEDDYVRALEWAESLGADVVSSSLGYFNWYTYADMDGNTAVTTVAADIAAAKGVTIVTAAGNEGPLPWPGIIAPSDGDSVIAVGAVDSNGVILSFSSRGPSFDGRIKPDVMAMGTAVVSAAPFDSLTYLRTQGTSLSTPLIAGAVALLLQMHPYWTPNDVWTALTNEASNAATPNNEYGWGIIDAYESALNGATGIMEGVVLNPMVRNGQVEISLMMPGAPGTTLTLQRRDLQVQAAYSWSPYINVMENIYVDSITPYVFTETLPAGIYEYRVQLASDPSLVSSPVDVRIPFALGLGQSYPNPFVRGRSNGLTIPYAVGGRPIRHVESHELSDYTDVSLVIYDVTGARVRTLI